MMTRPRDFIDHAVVVRARPVGERDTAGLGNPAGDHLINVHEHGLDRAIGRGAGRLSDVGGRLAVLVAALEQVREGGDLVAIKAVKHRPCPLGQLGVGQRLGLTAMVAEARWE